MSYTRLSMNFQPKTAQRSRRQFLLAGLATCASWQNLIMASAVAASKTHYIKAAPPMTEQIADENGALFKIDSLRGRPLLINFWAIWCAPCIAEMPSLQKAAEKLQTDGIDVLLISVDRGGPHKALPLLKSRGVMTPRYGFDPKAALSREMGVIGLPTSFLLSANQQQCVVYVGPREWHEEFMLDEIRHFLTG